MAAKEAIDGGGGGRWGGGRFGARGRDAARCLGEAGAALETNAAKGGTLLAGGGQVCSCRMGRGQCANRGSQ